MKSLVLVLCAVLALGACSRGENPDALFAPDAAGGGSTMDPVSGSVIGPDGRRIEVNSIEYFDEIIGDRVFFEVDQSNLTPQAMATLDRQATWLLRNSGTRISIEGHADEQGTREYNFRLSARRAASVRDYLVTKGIPDSRLSTIPYGKERPEAICSDETCWAKNRRAVTVVTGGLGA
jgi:peptidoglycan-associated lipoprotein